MRITKRDRVLLSFAADHRFVQPAHAGALLGVSIRSAEARLRALSTAGLLIRKRWLHGHPACYQVTGAGLGAIGSDLPRPRIDLRSYEHDVGLAWLWLAARDGRFGPMREVLAERQLRSRDGAAAAPSSAAAQGERGRPVGVRLGGVGPAGRERLHYPDLLLTTDDGHRIAVELELSSKGRVRREKILAGYGADARIDAVLYLVKDRRLGRSLQDSARRVGLEALVHVQQVGSPPAAAARADGRAAERSPPVAAR